MAGKRGKYNKSNGGMTHAEIGAVLGVTGQRVKQIEDAAFRKIRAAFPDLAVLAEGSSDSRVDSGIYHV